MRVRVVVSIGEKWFELVNRLGMRRPIPESLMEEVTFSKDVYMHRFGTANYKIGLRLVLSAQFGYNLGIY